jgi:hypothetical protein
MLIGSCVFNFGFEIGTERTLSDFIDNGTEIIIACLFIIMEPDLMKYQMGYDRVMRSRQIHSSI